MPNPWQAGYSRLSDIAQAVRERLAAEQATAGPPAPPINQGPRPPLTIRPQVGPVEQALHRALRERDVSPEVWALAQQTPVRAVPVEQMNGIGGGYDPYTGDISIGITEGKISDPWTRRTMAHELRHAYQDRNAGPTIPHWDNPNADNAAYQQNVQQWAKDPTQYGSERVRGGMDFLNQSGLYEQLYGGQVPPWESDAEIAADDLYHPGQQPMTAEKLPPNMRPSLAGWWAPNARPDPYAARNRGWGPAAVQMEDGSWGPPSVQYEDGSWGPATMQRGPTWPRR